MYRSKHSSLPSDLDELALLLRLHKTIAYDPLTGRLDWLVSLPGGYAKPGEPVGHYDKNGYLRIGFNGKVYTAPRLLWFYIHGKWPEGNLAFKDGNTRNLRFSNIGPRKPTSRRSAYQKRLRELNRKAKALIGSNPQRAAAWSAATDLEQKRMLREARNDITSGKYDREIIAALEYDPNPETEKDIQRRKERDRKRRQRARSRP